jgi:uncharacterized protein
VTEEMITFPSGDVTLTGGLTRSAGVSGATPLVIICHPHPQYGGSMYNNVVEGVMADIIPRGFSTLRFNFRGIGGSGGLSTGTLEDGRDVGAAVDFVSSLKDFTPIYLVGYSYGAWVGLYHAMSDERISAWAAVSPPVSMFDFSYLASTPVPKFFVAGDRDDFLNLGDLKSLVEKLDDPKELVVIPGADHFYGGYEAEVGSLVGGFLEGLG